MVYKEFETRPGGRKAKTEKANAEKMFKKWIPSGKVPARFYKKKGYDSSFKDLSTKKPGKYGIDY